MSLRKKDSVLTFSAAARGRRRGTIWQKTMTDGRKLQWQTSLNNKTTSSSKHSSEILTRERLKIQQHVIFNRLLTQQQTASQKIADATEVLTTGDADQRSISKASREQR